MIVERAPNCEANKRKTIKEALEDEPQFWYIASLSIVLLQSVLYKLDDDDIELFIYLFFNFF